MLALHKLRAVVFDLDDTLYSERDYVLSGFREVASWCEPNLGIPARDCFAELEELFNTGVRGSTFNQWLHSRGLENFEGIVAHLIRVYREHIPVLSPFPGVFPLLSELGPRYLVGLLSDGYLEVQKRKFEALGVRGHFNAVVFTDELGRAAWKPSPKGFKVLLEKLGVDGTEAVYIADNPEKDFIGAHSVGMLTIRLRTHRGLYAGIEPLCAKCAPNLEVADIASLAAVLSGDSVPEPSRE